MSYNPSIAWKASLTRTPPPICTPAPFPKPRWSEETVSVANAYRCTSSLNSRNENDSVRKPEKRLRANKMRPQILPGVARG